MPPTTTRHDGVPDQELVQAAQSGDRGALEALLRRHHDRIRAVAFRMTGNQADAADATQEAMLAIVRGLPRFDGRSSFTTWLYRVTTNACLDELRRRRRRPVPVDDSTTPERAADEIDPLIDTRLVTDAAIARLPEEYRVPVILRDLADLDYAEIAEVLGVPLGTVKSRIARGRGQLAAMLGNPAAPSERPTDEPLK